jgi:hypothetical protein
MNGRAESWHTEAESNLKNRFHTIVLIVQKVEVRDLMCQILSKAMKEELAKIVCASW